MCGDYTSLADAVGETPSGSYSGGWVAGVDWDPTDPDSAEVMGLVFAREREDTLTRLRRENDELRAELGRRYMYED